MVKHMIIWKLKDDISDKEAKKTEIKSKLEALEGKIDGLIKMRVLTDCFDSSAGDIMMDSDFTDREALKAYAKNPLHVAVADGTVRPAVMTRLSFDYEI